MTTSNDPRGRLSELYSGRQANLATPAAADFTRRHFYDLQPQPQSEPQSDDIMGGGFHNSIDERPAAPDVERASLRMVWPLDLVQIGWALTEFFGAPVTTGAGPYVHTFTSGTVQIPTTTFERKLGAGAFDGVIGAVARSLTFPIGADRGYTRINAEYFARQALDQYADSIAGAPATPALAARVPRAVGTIKKDGVALGAVISGDATLTNILGEDSYHGSRFIDDVQLEGRQAAANLTLRLKGAAARDFGKIEVGQDLPEAMDLELAWELTATLKLVLTLRNQRFGKVGIATSGPGRLDVPLRARGEVGAAADMVTAVLTNTQATYA